MKIPSIAIVGATGAVGEVLLGLLEDRKIDYSRLFLLASSRSAGEIKIVSEVAYTVEDVEGFDFSQVDIALFSAGGSVSEKYAPIASQAGAVVIDNTSHFRYQDNIPLIIPEVNPHKVLDYRNAGIIANPNCSTIQMLVALKPLYDAFGIDQIHVSTYQAVSGAGQKAVNELSNQTVNLLNASEVESEIFQTQISFNVIPQIDVMQSNGFTKEEMKMVWETQKIFEDASIEIHPTCVRVPVFYGHSESIYVRLGKVEPLEEIKTVLASAKGVQLFEEDLPPTPFFQGTNVDDVFVGRIRPSLDGKGVMLWVVSDNLRKGAALNSIQIMELLLESIEDINDLKKRNHR